MLVLAVPAAYALALRPMKKWKDVLFFFISTKFIPPAGIIVPLYIIFRDRASAEHAPGADHHLRRDEPPDRDLDAALILRRGAQAVLDAARVDGAGILREMTQILLPMVGPGLVATAFLSIIFAWNEFFFAVNLAATEQASTVPLFMQKFITSEGLFWAKLSAASTMAIAPVVMLGWISQRQLVRGLSMGAVK